MDIFRKLFGFPAHSEPQTRPDSFPRPHSDYNDRDIEDDEGSGRNFNVFTDPLEMHRYFEQQMDDFMKHFGIPNFGNFFHSFDTPGMLEEWGEPSTSEETTPNSRDQFLKKNYQKPQYEYSLDNEKVDKDLDGKLNIEDLDGLFQNPDPSKSIVVPNQDKSLNLFEKSKLFGGMSFNKSVQVKTVRRPDGSFETQRTVTDSDGNQETVITRRIGDKEYNLIKKRDKEGKEEIQENMINMTEDEKSLFDFSANTSKPLFDDFYSKFFK